MKKTKKKKPVEKRSNIKTHHRVWAMVLVIVLIVGLIASYGFMFTR